MYGYIMEDLRAYNSVKRPLILSCHVHLSKYIYTNYRGVVINV